MRSRSSAQTFHALAMVLGVAGALGGALVDHAYLPAVLFVAGGPLYGAAIRWMDRHQAWLA